MLKHAKEEKKIVIQKCWIAYIKQTSWYDVFLKLGSSLITDVNFSP